MSAIDPRVARIQSHDVVFTGTVAGWLAGFLALLHVLVWFVVALAAGATLDVVRWVILDRDNAEGFKGAFHLLVGWPLGVLVVLGFVLGAAVHGAAERVTSEGAASAIRLATAMCGLTFGLVSFASRWTRSQNHGFWPSEIGSPQEWGLLGWGTYWAPVWLPVVTGVIALVTTVMSATLVVRRIRTKARMVEVLKDGIHTSGHVSYVRSTEPDSNGMCTACFTVTYVDRTGQRRWVEKTMRLHSDEIPEVDGPAEVWYDQQRLNDLGRIAVDVVGAARGPRPTAVDADSD